MQVVGHNNRDQHEIEAAIESGGRLVFFEYCISLVFVTLRSPSRLYLLRADESGFWKGLKYSLVTLLLGWWGVPWGIIYTPLVLANNLSGGCEATAEWRERRSMAENQHSQ